MTSSLAVHRYMCDVTGSEADPCVTSLHNFTVLPTLSEKSIQPGGYANRAAFMIPVHCTLELIRCEVVSRGGGMTWPICAYLKRKRLKAVVYIFGCEIFLCCEEKKMYLINFNSLFFLVSDKAEMGQICCTWEIFNKWIKTNANTWHTGNSNGK